jgi:Carboxypeptidase regulatory-like domain/TonB dependent receptor/TonB-dependent Receptor Plug Domain
MWSRVSRQIFLVLFILMGCGCALAQLFPGRITGTVRDIQGAVIVGATVTLTAPEIGLQRSTVSDPEGYFNFPELPLSTFELKVAKDGFQTSIRRGIVTYAGQVNDVAVVLPVGTAASEVKVTEDLPLLQTETNTVGGQLTTHQITQLPVSNEDYTRLALVMPGVTQNTNFAFSNFTVNGARSRSSSFNVDGAANTDPYIQLPSMNQGGNSATAATRLPPDAIQEVQLVSHASAEYGQSSGGVMNALVKSGTNSLHGTIYEQHRDASLNAHNFFENLAGTPKAPFVWNNFGASLGAPLIPNRTFIFGAYDGSRLSIGTTFSSRAPTQAQIAEATSLVGTPNQLGLNILQLYQPLEGAFVVANRGKQTPNNGVLKVDHRFSSADSLSARYLIGDGLDEFPVGGPGPGGGSQLEKYFGVTPTRVHNFAISEVHIFSPNLLNTIRLGYNRFHQAFTNQDSNFDPASIGLITGSQDGGLPEIDVGSGDGRFVNLGTTPSFPSERHDTTYQIVDDISSTHRAHSLKLGINYFHNHSFGFNDNNFRGILTFDGSRGGNSLTTDGGVAGLVDLLSGEPASGPGSTINEGATRYDLSQNIFSAYVTDTYRVRSNFTLIAGLRYDLIGVPSEDNARFSNFLPSRGLVPVRQLPDGRIYELVKTNFAPRIAFSWSPSPSHSRQTVIRGGYGIYYDVTPLDLLVGEGLNIANTNPGLATNPIGTTGVFGVSAFDHIDINAPVFPPGTPQPPFNLIAVDPQLKPQNAQNYNFNIEQELAGSFVLQVGYVGGHGSRLFHLLDINQPTPGDPGDDADTVNTRRPFHSVFPDFQKIDVIRSLGWSHYNSLQATLRSRNFHGLTSQISFTWAHNMDTGSETLDFFGTSGYVPQDSTNLAAEYSESEFDQRRALILALVYEVPKLTESPGWKHLLNGWQISTLTQLRDGFAAPVLTFGNESGTNSLHDRPDCVGPIVTQLKDFNAPYVVSGLASPAPGTFGNCRRNPIVAPGLTTADISLGKNFPLREAARLEFRADFFNAFNHPNFGEPGPFLGGTITGTADDSSFDSHFGAGGPRNIQLGLRLRW